MYVIKLSNMYVAPWEGDPPRTFFIRNAIKFKTKKEAKVKLEEVKLTHPFREVEYEIIKYKVNAK